MANTITDKLTYLNGTKDAIKQAIIAKGVEVTDTDTFRSYANKIEAIQSGGGGTVNIPDGTKFGYSTFTTVPTEIIPYLEAQTDLSGIFKECRSLTTVALFDTSRATDINSIFYNCQKIQTVANFDTSNVTNIKNAFYHCRSLTTLPQLNTANVIYMSGTFWNCTSLQTVPQLNVNRVEGMDNTFLSCYSLTNLGGFTGLKVNLDLSTSPKLTVDSVMNVINNAADMTSNPQTLNLHKNVFNKLSAEQIATASAKGWNIASD